MKKRTSSCLGSAVRGFPRMAKSALRSRVRFPHRLANSPPAKKSVMSVPNSFSSSAFGTFTAKCRAVSGTRGPSPVIPQSRCQFVPPPLPRPYIMGPARMPPEDAVGRSILIVEDEKEIRDLLVHYLRREGFSPTVAPDGETGWEEARKEGAELILLDIPPPGREGLGLLRKVRTDPA